MAAAVPTLLSVNNYFYRRGGAETLFFAHNALLQGRGWQVVPFAMQHPSNEPSPWSAFFPAEIEYGTHYSPWRTLRNSQRVVYSLDARERLAHLLENVGAQVAHVHNIYHHLSPSVVGLLRSRHIPVVMTVHDLKLLCPAYTMYTHDGVCERCSGGRIHNLLLHRCMKGSAALSALVLLETALHRALGLYGRNVSRFVVPSRFYLEKFREWGWDTARFRYIPNFIDARALRPATGAGTGFLYFGRIAREKGLATLIRAAALARVPVRILGSGDQEPGLRALAGELGADVAFGGFLGGSALHDAVRSARAVVLPSEWYENAPLSVLEAYALGRPVIGAAIGGIPELVREGETGFTFKAGSAEALAAQLLRVAAMPDARLAAMGDNARRWVETEFSPERYCTRITTLYRELGAAV